MAATIGTRIRKRRQVLGMTQQQLADQLSVSKSTVANWEIDKHFPLRYLGAIEEALGVNLDDDAQAARVIPPEMRKLIRETLPDDVEAQRRVIGLLEGTLTWPAEGLAEAGQPEDRSHPRAV